MLGNFPKTIFGVFVEEKQSNLNNVAHGGFLMAFADSVGGYFAYKTVKKSIVTVNLNSNFISLILCWILSISLSKVVVSKLIFLV